MTKTRREVAAIGRAIEIVAILERVEDLTKESEGLLRRAEELMAADYISAEGAEDNARAAAELRIVLRVGFHRAFRRLLHDWDGYLSARKA